MACGNLLKAFVEIHNSLRSDNGFPFITQLLADQEVLLRLHMKPGGKQRAGLGVETGAGLAWAAEGLVLMRLEKRIVG